MCLCAPSFPLSKPVHPLMGMLRMAPFFGARWQCWGSKWVLSRAAHFWTAMWSFPACAPSHPVHRSLRGHESAPRSVCQLWQPRDSAGFKATARGKSGVFSCKNHKSAAPGCAFITAFSRSITCSKEFCPVGLPAFEAKQFIFPLEFIFWTRMH